MNSCGGGAYASGKKDDGILVNSLCVTNSPDYSGPGNAECNAGVYGQAAGWSCVPLETSN